MIFLDKKDLFIRYKKYSENKKYIEKRKQIGFSDDFETMMMSYNMYLTIQQITNRITRYVCEPFCQPLKPKLKLGDYVYRQTGEKFEVKSCFINDTNDQLSLIQIRPYEKYDSLVIIESIFIMDSNINGVSIYEISKKSEENFLEHCDASPSHGDTKSELSIHIKLNSENYKYLQNYKIDRCKKFQEEIIKKYWISTPSLLEYDLGKEFV